MINNESAWGPHFIVILFIIESARLRPTNAPAAHHLLAFLLVVPLLALLDLGLGVRGLERGQMGSKKVGKG